MHQNACASVRRRFLGAALAVAFATALAACGSSAGNDTQTSGSTSSSSSASSVFSKWQQDGVKIAVIDDPPYSDIDASGQPVGLAPAIAVAILHHYGVTKITPVLATFASVIPGLQAGHWDMIASSLDITKARCQVVSFSNPISGAPDVFIVPKGNPLGLDSMKAAIAKHATVGLESGTAEVAAAEALGLPASSIVLFPDDQSELSGLEAGRVDLVETSYYNALALKIPSKYEITGPIPDMKGFNTSSLAFPKTDTAIRDAFDSELATMEQSGQYATLAKQYGLDPAFINGLTAAQVCGALPGSTATCQESQEALWKRREIFFFSKPERNALACAV